MTNAHEWWVADKIPKSGDVAIDVGAGIGIYTATLADRFKNVIAFEPHPGNREVVKVNMGARTNVEIRPEAAMDHEGKLSLHFHKIMGAVEPCHSSIHEKHPVRPAEFSGEKIEVPCLRIDTLEFPGKVDFIKVDVEGAEIKVLLGARDTIAKFRPELMIEVHSHEYTSFLEGFLGALKYKWEKIDHPTDIPVTWYWLYAKPE